MKEARIQQLEGQMTAPDFWDNQNAAQTVINETNALKEMVDQFHELNESYENLQLTYELVKEEEDAELQ
ncbi:peptide chain release factor 2, partial [Shouchella clausii]